MASELFMILILVQDSVNILLCNKNINMMKPSFISSQFRDLNNKSFLNVTGQVNKSVRRTFRKSMDERKEEKCNDVDFFFISQT